MSSTITNRLCSKIGITENSIKNSTIFSPPKKTASTPNNKFDYKSNLNTDNKGSYSNQQNISPSKKRGTKYECFKIDILVPNSEPPKPQIQAYNPTNKKESNTTKGGRKINSFGSSDMNKVANNNIPTFNSASSPMKKFTDNFSKRLTIGGGGKSNLENLSNSIKLGNIDLFNPLSKAHQQVENKTSRK